MSNASMQLLSRFSPLDLRRNMRKTDELSYVDEPADIDRDDPVQAPRQDTQGQFSPTQERLSRFTACHTRVKPKPRVRSAPKDAPCAVPATPVSATPPAVADQMSNEGADVIPLSVLKSALRSRVTPQGGMDAVSAMISAPSMMRMAQGARA